MVRRIEAQSADPGAAAQEILEQVNYTGEPVEMVFHGEIGGRHCRDLTVEVRPGTPADDVVQAMQKAARTRR